MDKYKYLASNTIIFFISSFSSKILVFLLLPLYTTVLTTSEYAISDLISTSVDLLYIVLTLAIAEGVMRFALDKNYDKAQVLHIGFLFIIISSIILCCGVVIIAKFSLVNIFEDHWVQFILLYMANSTNNLLAGFMRGTEKIKLIAVTGVMGSVVTVTSNILLLLVFKWGIDGYIWSMVFMNTATTIIYFYFGDVYQYKTRQVLRALDKELLIEIVKYSTPIVATQLCWWVNSAADRYIVVYLLGTSEAGLLSAAHRIPSLLTVFTGIFMQAWTLSAIKEYGSEESQRFFSKMLNMYNALLIVGGAIVIVLVKPISALIFKGDFLSAWYLAPPFILAFSLNGISAFLGTFFLANKETKSLMYSTFIGALINIVLCYIMVGKIGTVGAGVATAFSYLTVSVIRTVQVERSMKLYLELKRIIPSYVLLIVLTAVISYDLVNSFIFSLMILIILIVLNYQHIIDLISKSVEILRTYRKAS